ncbi:aly/REF export factor 2-like [Drosophila teissieri]|uniref:aly/REF export factor 2-like n=1 Tax=Drosophila teissieri TaxID=7243 RepID=UPI001CBA50AE|nr:aly/REF export factor 2-like [Drosophila teissieri]
MLDKMEMSLDDIIKLNLGLKNKVRHAQKEKVRKSTVEGGFKGVRRSRKATGFIQKPKFKQGKTLKEPKRPTFLMVCNLDYGVDDDDIMELFNESGLVQQGLVHYDREGNSLGTAQLMCKYRADAMKIIRQFHGVFLDGRRLKLHLIQKTRDFKRPDGESRGSLQSRPFRHQYYQPRPSRPGAFKSLSFAPRPSERDCIQVDSSSCESLVSDPMYRPKSNGGTFRKSGLPNRIRNSTPHKNAYRNNDFIQ